MKFSNQSRLPEKVALCRQSGLSLIELMISITLGIFIMSGVVQLFLTGTETTISAQGLSRIQENVRYAMGRMSNDIARAGDYGCLTHPVISRAGQGTASNINNLIASTPTAGDWNDFAGSFISGVNDDAEGGAADNPSVLNGSDTLIVKYVDHGSAIEINGASVPSSLTLSNTVTLPRGQLMIASNCDSTAIFTLNADVSGTIVPTGSDHRLSINNMIAYLYSGETGAHEYYIGSTAGGTCSATQPEDCSLFRRSNDGVAQELVQGVHELEVQYGVENNGVLVTYSDDASANGYSNIDRVQITMSFNAIDGGPGESSLLTKQVTRIFSIRNQL